MKFAKNVNMHGIAVLNASLLAVAALAGGGRTLKINALKENGEQNENKNTDFEKEGVMPFGMPLGGDRSTGSYGVGSSAPIGGTRYMNASPDELRQIMQGELLPPEAWDSLPQKIRSVFGNYRTYASNWAMGRKSKDDDRRFFDQARTGQVTEPTFRVPTGTPTRTGTGGRSGGQQSGQPQMRKVTDIRGNVSYVPAGGVTRGVGGEVRAMTPGAQAAAGSEMQRLYDESQRIPRMQEAAAKEQHDRKVAADKRAKEEIDLRISQIKRETLDTPEKLRELADLEEERERLDVTKVRQAQARIDQGEERIAVSRERIAQQRDNIETRFKQDLAKMNVRHDLRGSELKLQDKMFRGRMQTAGKISLERAEVLANRRQEELNDKIRRQTDNEKRKDLEAAKVSAHKEIQRIRLTQAQTYLKRGEIYQANFILSSMQRGTDRFYTELSANREAVGDPVLDIDKITFEPTASLSEDIQPSVIEQEAGTEPIWNERTAQPADEVSRMVNGRPAIFDSATKQFIRWGDQ